MYCVLSLVWPPELTQPQFRGRCIDVRVRVRVRL